MCKFLQDNYYKLFEKDFDENSKNFNQFESKLQRFLETFKNSDEPALKNTIESSGVALLPTKKKSF